MNKSTVNGLAHLAIIAGILICIGMILHMIFSSALLSNLLLLGITLLLVFPRGKVFK